MSFIKQQLTFLLNYDCQAERLLYASKENRWNIDVTLKQRNRNLLLEYRPENFPSLSQYNQIIYKFPALTAQKIEVYLPKIVTQSFKPTQIEHGTIIFTLYYKPQVLQPNFLPNSNICTFERQLFCNTTFMIWIHPVQIFADNITWSKQAFSLKFYIRGIFNTWFQRLISMYHTTSVSHRLGV